MFCHICLEEADIDYSKYLIINENNNCATIILASGDRHRSEDQPIIAYICFTCDKGSIPYIHDIYYYKHIFRKDGDVMFMSNVLAEAEEYRQRYKEFSYLE